MTQPNFGPLSKRERYEHYIIKSEAEIFSSCCDI
jgi:hypothetical protein